MRVELYTLCLLIAASHGCDRDERPETKAPASSDDEPRGPKPSAVAPATASATASASASASPTNGPLRPATSTIPDAAAWTAAPEVVVAASSRLPCEAKLVGEYFRARCRATIGHGAVQSIKVLNGVEARVDSDENAATLVIPYVEGTSVAARFGWNDQSAILVVHGRSKPLAGEPIGTFYFPPPKNARTGPDCPPETVPGPENYCLAKCTSQPIDTCPKRYTCTVDDTGGFPSSCVPDGKRW